MIQRSSLINRSDRITGDSLCVVADLLTKKVKKLDFVSLDHIINKFVEYQVLNPDFKVSRAWRLSLDREKGPIA